MRAVVVVKSPSTNADAEGADTTEKRLKLNADTATSAMRLIDVFVDICFLSIKVDFEDFSRSAWLKNAFSSDMSDCSF